MPQPLEPVTPPVSTFRHFLAGIVDFRFQRNLTMQLLPLFYTLLLLGAALVILTLMGLAFWLSPMAGLASLVIGPVAFFIAVAVIRAALEYLVMAYRIMQTVNGMDRIPGQVDNLNARVDHVVAEVDHIRRQFDEVAHTVQLLRPVLQPLSFPSRLVRSMSKRTPPA